MLQGMPTVVTGKWDTNDQIAFFFFFGGGYISRFSWQAVEICNVNKMHITINNVMYITYFLLINVS